jgi:hypothetical protein
MADITDSIVGELKDPKLRAVLSRTVREFELAAEKVAAHQAEPANYPLPTEVGTTEQILAQRFRELPARQRIQTTQEALARVKGGAGLRRRRLDGLDAVRLGLVTPIEEQVSAIPVPVDLGLSSAQVTGTLHAAGLLPTRAEAAAVAAGASRASRTAAEAGVGAAPARTNKLELRIHRVFCQDETGPSLLFIGPPDSDEIYLGGTTIGGTGGVGGAGKVKAFNAGSFDTGERKTYSPPKRFTWFDLQEGAKFPKSYFVTLVLAEKNMGGLPEFLSRLLEKVKVRVQHELRKAGIEADESGGLVSAFIALAASWVLDHVWDVIGRAWNEDIFTPQTIQIQISSPGTRWAGGKTDSPERALTFKGRQGQYEITYDWRLFA